MIKRTQKESDREANTNNGRIYQNRTTDKDQFFRGPSVAQIEKCKTNESLQITWGICTRNRRSKGYSENFHEFLQCSVEIYFRTTTSPILTSLKLEVLLGTKKNKNDKEKSLQ
jgi:sulfatase maturation enzyme AslB (radical SAM superfamily)